MFLKECFVGESEGEGVGVNCGSGVGCSVWDARWVGRREGRCALLIGIEEKGDAREVGEGRRCREGAEGKERKCQRGL